MDFLLQCPPNSPPCPPHRPHSPGTCLTPRTGLGGAEDLPAPEQDGRPEPAAAADGGWRRCFLPISTSSPGTLLPNTQMQRFCFGRCVGSREGDRFQARPARSQGGGPRARPGGSTRTGMLGRCVRSWFHRHAPRTGVGDSAAPQGGSSPQYADDKPDAQDCMTRSRSHRLKPRLSDSQAHVLPAHHAATLLFHGRAAACLGPRALTSLEYGNDGVGVTCGLGLLPG